MELTEGVLPTFDLTTHGVLTSNDELGYYENVYERVVTYYQACAAAFRSTRFK